MCFVLQHICSSILGSIAFKTLTHCIFYMNNLLINSKRRTTHNYIARELMIDLSILDFYKFVLDLQTVASLIWNSSGTLGMICINTLCMCVCFIRTIIDGGYFGGYCYLFMAKFVRYFPSLLNYNFRCWRMMKK